MISDLLARSSADAGAPALSLSAFACFEQLFDELPEIVFFIKDTQGRYVGVNQTLVGRCGLREKRELLHRRVQDLFSGKLAERFVAQDEQVLRKGVPIIDRLELHWYECRRLGWCLTTKLPLRDQAGAIVGLLGMSRDLRLLDDGKAIPAGVVAALEYLESHFADTISPTSLATRAGISTVRFARLIKRVHRLTPHELIVQTRLAAAIRLLTETDHSVAQIALECGFYDHSAFTRAFRSAMNVTPTRFRAAPDTITPSPPAGAGYDGVPARLRYAEGRQPILDLKMFEKMRGIRVTHGRGDLVQRRIGGCQ